MSLAVFIPVASGISWCWSKLKPLYQVLESSCRNSQSLVVLWGVDITLQGLSWFWKSILQTAWHPFQTGATFGLPTLSY